MLTGLDKLIEDICSREYEYRGYDGKMTKTKVVSQFDSGKVEARAAISGAVYEWGSQHITDFERDRKLGELEAKCFAYEKLISNSNFAPMVMDDGKSDLMKVFDEMQARLANVATFHDIYEDGMTGPYMCQHDEVMKVVGEYRDRVAELGRRI